MIAGISVALVLIPQSLAYAEIAGVPPHVGLFASALPPLLAAPFASSPYLQTGPVALTSLLTFGALSGLEATGTAEYVQLAALLALVVGVTRLVLGLMQMGAIAYLMSQPVLVGFTSAAAVLIISSQVPAMFGVFPDEDDVLARAWSVVTEPAAWDATAVTLSVITVAVVLGSRRVHQLLPGVLIVVIAAVVWSEAVDHTGAEVGDLPGGFITLSLDLPYGDIGSLIVPGIVIALVGFAEPASIARTFATADRIPWSANRELVSQGVANLASGLVVAIGVGSLGIGSPARTSSRSPSRSWLTGTTACVAPSRRVAVFGSSDESAALRSIERCRARISRKRPSVRKNTNIVTESNHTASPRVNVASTDAA